MTGMQRGDAPRMDAHGVDTRCADAHWADAQTPWRSGPWAFELRGDEIADLTYDGRRVLRSIRAVVRDSDWNTAEWMLDAPVTERTAGLTRLRLPLRSTGYGSDIRGGLIVEAQDDALTVTFDAVSCGAYPTNRTGLVVLHPAGVSGAPLRVVHASGTSADTVFPVAISPHQPVRDIAALTWVDDGLEIEAAFAGDTFEMEDQRNWTDASYKTYNRPLDLPFPYELADGERVLQSIRLRVSEVAPASPGAPATPTIRLAPAGPFPAIGVAASEAPDPRTPLSQLPVPPGMELVVELDLCTRSWWAALTRAAGRGLPLDVRVVVSADDHAPLRELAAALQELTTHSTAGVPVVVARIAVFDAELHVSDAATVTALRLALDRAGVEVPMHGGSRSHFTELNRERHRLPDGSHRDANSFDGLDGLVTTVTPLFHSLSTAQLVESVAMQRLVAEQSVAYAAGLPVRIGPISLRPRFNNVATRAQPAPLRDDLAEGYGAEFTGAVDARQRCPELAAWTIASAAALAVPGVAGLCYFEEWGPRGIRADDGAPYPVAAALEALTHLAGGAQYTELLTVPSPDGLLWAIGARTGAGGARVLVANLDARERSLAIEVPGHADRIGVTLPGFGWHALATDTDTDTAAPGPPQS